LFFASDIIGKALFKVDIQCTAINVPLPGTSIPTIVRFLNSLIELDVSKRITILFVCVSGSGKTGQATNGQMKLTIANAEKTRFHESINFLIDLTP
jgi:hypothetical protein